MLMPRLHIAACSLLLAALAACSESATQQAEKKELATPDPPITGREAFQRMYISARGWASDASPVQLQSYNLPSVKASDGKAGAWQAVFTSASRARSRSYSWSAIESEGNLHKGVFAGPEESSSSSQRSFLVAFIKYDSDDALKVALKQPHVEAYLKKHPDRPLQFLLDFTDRVPDPAWRVMWGDSPSTAECTIYVDASTGKFAQKDC